jgi:two-component system heavy metal sensor histidine kinase CusS
MCSNRAEPLEPSCAGRAGLSSAIPGATLSITAQLAGLFSLIAFSVLLVSSLVLYETLVLNLDREKEQFLADEVTTLRGIQAGHPEIGEALLDEVQLESDASHYSHYFVRILGQGQLLLETSGMSALVPAVAFPPPVSEDRTPGRSLSYTTRDGRRFLLIAALARGGSPAADPREMQIAIDDSARDIVTSSYRRNMAWVVAFGTLAATLAAAAVARRGMRPLREIARHAHGITATQLHERIGSAQWPPELVHVARSFDDMLQRLEASFVQLSRLSADLAHELRTPINNLMGEAEVALSRHRTNAEYRRVIESSQEEFGRLSRLIESMLFLARAESAETPLQREQLDGRAELERVREFFEALADQRQVRVSCSGSASLRVDSILFRRAVSNLLSNALEHTPAGGRVELNVEHRGEAVEVSVSDTGCGVEGQHLPRLFDRFYRVDQARSGPARGTGLGLALVKSIVELHQGSAQIESTPRKGTRVLLRFP